MFRVEYLPPFVPARRTCTRPAMTPRRCGSTPRHGLMEWPTLFSLFLLLTFVASPVSCSTPPSSTWTSASTSASSSSSVPASRLRSHPAPASSPPLAERASSSVACVPYQGAPATGGKCDSVVTYSHILLLPGQTYAQVPPFPLTIRSLLWLVQPPVSVPLTILFPVPGTNDGDHRRTARRQR